MLVGEACCLLLLVCAGRSRRPDHSARQSGGSLGEAPFMQSRPPLTSARVIAGRRGRDSVGRLRGSRRNPVSLDITWRYSAAANEPVACAGGLAPLITSHSMSTNS